MTKSVIEMEEPEVEIAVETAMTGGQSGNLEATHREAVHHEPVHREPSHEEIAKLAHTYWLSRSPDEGCAEDDWYRAEKELRSHQK